MAHGVGVGHAGPLETDIQVVDAQFVAVALDFADDFLGVADQEAVPC